MAAFDRPDQTQRVEVDGHEVVTYAWGTGGEAVFLLSGGPGLPCRYLVEPHLRLVDRGYRVVSYDQLGTGASDRPSDPSLWHIERYAREVETVRKALGLDRFHLIGHSWGGWLGIEYAVTFPDALASFVIADSAGDIPHLVSELNRLRSALGPETVRMMQQREAECTIEHEEYKAAITLLDYRHVCRLETWPRPLIRSIEEWNKAPYETVQGPNEFLYTGNLKDWNRLDEMKRIDRPCLVVVGAYDELTPACALRMHKALPNSEIAVFANSSHTPFYEEPDAYFSRIEKFLAEQK
ncbi:proline iminopeptidase-family hydrolase [Ferruginivarius sediminum]|uniref:Alpha/beta fold hydrolase n=1 Tax=Ferruginivarius sediminum TaxID=2661937 RepID=A0A369T736_9PROT|nr:proline iminopeptidase-family hydrolase [Ferruginivarius sediminum]RDD61088.1 alpha/beta fold hydrolase [Ferruginivarius sediminum]